MADNDNNLVFTVSSDMSAAQRGLNKFVTDVGTSTAQISKKFEAAGAKIDASTTALQMRINGIVGLGTKSTKEWTGALADQGRELERLRARYSPLFATLNNYKTAVAEIKRAHAVGAISANEMTAAISRERQAALASTAALKGRNAALVAANDTGGGVGGNAGFRRQNLGYQAFDIGQGLASGMPLGMIAAQQGPQIAQLYAGNGGVKGALKDVAAIAGAAAASVGALPLALATAGAAALAYFKLTEKSAKTVDEVLKEHQENIKALGDAYGVAEEKARSYSAADRAVATAATQGSLEELNKQQVQSARELRKQFGSMQTPGRGGQAFFNLFPDYKPFASAFQDLDNGIRKGRVEGEKFIDAISEIARINPQYDEFANKILKSAKEFLQLNTEVSKTKDLLTQIGTLSPLDPLGVFNPQRAIDEKAARTPSQTQQLQAQRDALKQSAMARTVAEREAAAKASAAAQFNADENPTDRENRIAMAGYEARLQAERQLADAQRERAMGLPRILPDQQLEIDLIGKTGGAAVALRKEYELISALKDEAARNGTKVDQAEIDAIKEKTRQLGQLTDTYNKLKLQQDLLLDARFNSLSKQDQQITTVLRQYGLSEDLNSNEAGQIRKSLNIEDARSELKSFFGDFKDALLNNGGDIGKAFAESISNSLLNATSKIWDRWIDTFVNQLIGTPSVGGAAASNGSGLGALFSGLFSGGSTKGAAGSVTSSSVTALSGSISDYARAIQSIESGGNYGALGPVTKSGDRAYGAYQVMGANIPSWTQGALGKSLTSSEFLSSKSAQDAVFEKYFGASVSKFGNPQDAASVWFTGRPLSKGAGASDILGTTGSEYVDKFTKSLGSASDAINVQMGRTTESAASLGKLATSTGTATDGLGQLGNGLGQFGNTLSSASANGGSGGGFFDWLGKLFGGGAFTPIGAQATLAASGGIGLYADGGHVSGPGGPTSDDVPAMLSNGEYVINASSTRRHRRLLDAINSGSIARFASGGLVRGSASRASGGSGGGGVVVNIQNNSSAQIKQQSRETSNGTQIDVVIDELVADKMSTPGSRSRGAMASQFGLKGGLARR